MAYQTKIVPPFLFPNEEMQSSAIIAEKWKLSNFSAGNVCSDVERKRLENKYWGITEVTDMFNRQTVSYQLSKNESLHRWLKYREGFSAQLVADLLSRFNIKEGDLVMDPFMGSGTTGIVCCIEGINSIGYDILPMSKLAIAAKTAVYDYDIEELQKIIVEIRNTDVPDDYNCYTPEISITIGAYPETESKAISFYTEHFKNSDYSINAKTLISLCILNVLESVSYTIKTGQYLSWDHRCPKIIEINNARIAAGKSPFVNDNDKGKLPTLKEALLSEFCQMVDDIITIQKRGTHFSSKCDYIEGSVLFEITNVPNNSIDGVITSPPYCNRYDYTRTYGLELAYLNKNDEEVKELRQKLLSCTVENKTKILLLHEHYKKIGRHDEYKKVLDIFFQNKVRNEINDALKSRNEKGDINNKGVLRMVDCYFLELTVLFSELYRICKPGAHVAFVNDNVRYAGEVIPVDYLCTELAEQIGFKPVKIYTLKQQKGNSSQQMSKYGRVALRKSITIWQK